jgi:hypothetical protein
MNALLIAGTRIVMIALISYSIAIITEQRKKVVNNVVLVFITLGIITDIVATGFMIAGSDNSPFTAHGILGYSSLLAMLIDTVLIWRHRILTDKTTQVSPALHSYSRYAYIWWLLAFITGALLVLLK